MKLYNQPIETIEHGFIWQGREYTVKSSPQHWQLTQRWWLKEDRIDREYYMVLAETPGGTEGTYELYKNLVNNQWYLNRVYD